MPRNIHEDLQNHHDTKSHTFNTTFGMNPPYTKEQSAIIDLETKVAELEAQCRIMVSHIGALETKSK